MHWWLLLLLVLAFYSWLIFLMKVGTLADARMEEVMKAQPSRRFTIEHERQGYVERQNDKTKVVPPRFKKNLA